MERTDETFTANSDEVRRHNQAVASKARTAALEEAVKAIEKEIKWEARKATHLEAATPQGDTLEAHQEGLRTALAIIKAVRDLGAMDG